MQVSPTKKRPFPSYHHSFFGPFFLAARLARAPLRSCRRRSSPSLSGADGPPPVVCFKPLPSMRRRDPSSPGNWKSPNDRAKERPFREAGIKKLFWLFQLARWGIANSLSLPFLHPVVRVGVGKGKESSFPVDNQMTCGAETIPSRLRLTRLCRTAMTKEG